MLHKSFLAAVLAVSGGGSAALAKPTTTTTSTSTDPELVAHVSAGIIVGGLCPHSQTRHFQGIPYAKPPVSSLRFMPPQKFSGKYPGGMLNATTPPPACVQFPSPFDVEGAQTSEDCLYLDVYVPPQAKPSSALPVKVWSYGGANLGGALTLPMYDACSLASNAADNAILVSFNYRLGPLGFLALADAGIGGNMAIQDYLAALTWVKENIASFGGDPAKVLLFGQSAGGDNSFVVSTLPEAKGLVSAVAVQSGGGQDLTPLKTAHLTATSYAKTLGCDTKDLACLQSKPVDALRDAYSKTPALNDPAINGGILGIIGVELPKMTTISSTVLDGKIVKQEALKVGSQVPIIAGSTSDDASLLVLPYAFDFINRGERFTEANYTSIISEFGPSIAPDVLKHYPLSLFNNSGTDSPDPTTFAVVGALTHIATTAGFICNNHKLLRAASAAGTTGFAFRLNRTLTCPWLWQDGKPFPGPDFSDFFGATHTAEIPFLFGNMDNQPWGNGTCNASQSDRALSKEFAGAWTAMAANGNPSTAQKSWPKFDAHSDMGIYVGEQGMVSQKLDFDECEFWDGVFAKLGGYVPTRSSKPGCTSHPHSSSS